jgi:VanZ family protein
MAVIWLLVWALFSLPWSSPSATPHWERMRAPHVRASSQVRVHHVLNVLFYVPAAPLGSLVGLPLAASVAAASALSVGAEAAQVYSLDRAPDGNDLVANIGGAVIGALGLLVYRRTRHARFQRTAEGVTEQ